MSEAENVSPEERRQRAETRLARSRPAREAAAAAHAVSLHLPSINPHASAKHTLTLLAPLYEALKRSAKNRGLDPHELIVQLIENRVIDDETLDEYSRNRVRLARYLTEKIVATARRLASEGRFSPAITLDTIKECTADPTWASKYRDYVEDDIYKHGNPLKIINREFGFRIRAAIDGKVEKDAKGKPVKIKVAGQIIQSYTPMKNYGRCSFE